MTNKINVIIDEIISDIDDDQEQPALKENENDINSFEHKVFETTISMIELVLFNRLFFSLIENKIDGFKIDNYGTVDRIGRIVLGGDFNETNGFWFNLKDDNNINDDVIVQTIVYIDDNNCMRTRFQITTKFTKTYEDYKTYFESLKKLAFNKSMYKGKCLKVKFNNNHFYGVEIIEVENTGLNIILTDTQKHYIKHFVNRIKNGHNVRYLLNGFPGTGKTQTIREIMLQLLSEATFIIPEFETNSDLNEILNACQIFDKGIIIMDDIDLSIGSRDNGSYTRFLSNFLAFFDGVKKNKVSLLASTNDKRLVDKAAERPGRFNMILDYGFLTDEQIIEVAKIYLPKKWQIKEVYDSMVQKINNKKVNITGAFIFNLSENLKEMSENDNDWSLKDTLALIKDSYMGFYLSQIDKEELSLGFQINK